MAKRNETKVIREEKERKIMQSRKIGSKRVKMRRKRPLKKKLPMQLVGPKVGSTDYLKESKEVLVIDMKEHDSFSRRHSRSLFSEEYPDRVFSLPMQSKAGNNYSYDQQISPVNSVSGNGWQCCSKNNLELSGMKKCEEVSRQVETHDCETSFNEDSFLSSSPQVEDIPLKRRKVENASVESVRLNEMVFVVDGMQTPADLCKEYGRSEGFQRIINFSDRTNNDQLISRSNKIRKHGKTSNKIEQISFSSPTTSQGVNTPYSQLDENFNRIDLPDISIVDVDEDFMYDNEEGTREREKDDFRTEESSLYDSEIDEEVESIHESCGRIESGSEIEQVENDSDDSSEYSSPIDRDDGQSFEGTENIESPLPSNKNVSKPDEELKGQRSDCNAEDQVISNVNSPLVKVPESMSEVNASHHKADSTSASNPNSERTSEKRPKMKQVKKKKSPFRLFHHVERGKAILFFPEDAEAPFVGRVCLQTLVGSVTVNSFKVKADKCWYPVYAIRTTNIPTLKVKVAEDHMEQKHKEEISNIEKMILGKDKAEFSAIAAKGPFAALLLRRLDCSAWSYAKQLNMSEYDGNVSVKYEIPICLQFSQIFSELGFFLYPFKYCGVSQLRPLKCLPGQENAIGSILNSYKESNVVPVTVVCGQQDSGKSTFTRNLVNSFLNETDGICYIEADTGQSELTPSCLLSLHYVTEPLLGVPFVHQRQPAKMFFFGSNEPKRTPDLYLEMLTALHQYYIKTFPSKPLVVNTNGWVTGLGAFLLTDILHIMMPTQIVLLKENDQVAASDFFSERSWLRNEDETDPLPSQILTVQAAPKNPSRSKVLRRNLTFVGYLSKLFKPSLTGQKLKLSSVTPYVVPWSSVAVHVCNHTLSPNHILYALNASVVGLCIVDHSKMFEIEGSVPSDGLPKILKETPVCDCLGLGIVRGIDPVTKVFYIITPVPAEELPRVTALLKGTHSFPHEVLKEDFDTDILPYMATSVNPVSVSHPNITTRYLSRRPSAITRNLQNMATKAR